MSCGGAYAYLLFQRGGTICPTSKPKLKVRWFASISIYGATTAPPSPPEPQELYDVSPGHGVQPCLRCRLPAGALGTV